MEVRRTAVSRGPLPLKVAADMRTYTLHSLAFGAYACCAAMRANANVAVIITRTAPQGRICIGGRA